MYSPRGQNWGFPLYDWDALRAQDYAFWRQRLGYADRFYTAYRIDHVLGFFRIWAISAAESDAYIGAFEPSERMRRPELISLGFSDERIRWLSKPHVPEWKIQASEQQCLAEQPAADRKASLGRGAWRTCARPASFAIRKSRFSSLIRQSGARAISMRSSRTCVRDFPKAGHSLDEYARGMGDW